MTRKAIRLMGLVMMGALFFAAQCYVVIGTFRDSRMEREQKARSIYTDHVDYQRLDGR